MSVVVNVIIKLYKMSTINLFSKDGYLNKSVYVVQLNGSASLVIRYYSQVGKHSVGPGQAASGTHVARISQ